MYFGKKLLVFKNSLKYKNFRSCIFIIIISKFLRTNNCISIIVDFENYTPEQACFIDLLISYNKNIDSESGITDFKQTKIYNPKTDPRNPYLDDIGIFPNTGGVLNSESDTIEKNIDECTSFNTELDVSGEKQAFEVSASSREPIDIVKFDYSDLFMIRSKHLDELEKTENNQIRLNIRDNTKIEVYSHIFRECMNVLKIDETGFSWYKKEDIIELYSFSYRIKGIKISNKDMYYTERKDLNHACKIMNENSIIHKMNASYVQVFTNTEITESDDIISIEFENIVISNRKNLESLILVRCNIPDTNFLRQLSSYFSKLRNLYIVGFIFNNKFFRYLHVMKIECLDIPFCKYKGNPAVERTQRKLHPNKLQDSKFYYAMQCFRDLHMRGFSSVRFIHFKDCKNRQKTFRSLDLSFCQINSVYMDFFCTDIKAENLCLDQFYKIDCFKKILNQKSLHTSTKKLTLSNNLMSEDIFSYLAAFEVLEYLNLSFLKCNSVNFLNSDYKFKSKLLYLDLSGNELQKTNFSFINQFDYLSRLDLSDCKLKCEFMSYLTNSFLIASLKVINLSRNILCSSDISRICLLENLIYLVITLDNKVFSEFLKEYGVLECLSLETIVLIHTNVDADIKKFIISQPSLKNVRLRGCMMESNSLTMNSNVSPDFFKTIVC
ncbi:hypothetical protein CWI36_1094p0010 [Hamiltosporidium magnivora]|uniref:Leucine-rich repeat-containing protein n=1 Tax=Hamiltosporidium magnivora TaxID=148818 RepID=A0A4Q9L4Q2_9MICR|nr:hypothetical protein CWI36_1094p0010 [Hamiltosporidium magnivora]